MVWRNLTEIPTTCSKTILVTESVDAHDPDPGNFPLDRHGRRVLLQQREHSLHASARHPYTPCLSLFHDCPTFGQLANQYLCTTDRERDSKRRGRDEGEKQRSTEPEIYGIYDGEITKLMDFGCFVSLTEFGRGQFEGLCHSSQIAPGHINVKVCLFCPVVHFCSVPSHLLPPSPSSPSFSVSAHLLFLRPSSMFALFLPLPALCTLSARHPCIHRSTANVAKRSR